MSPARRRPQSRTPTAGPSANVWLIVSLASVFALKVALALTLASHPLLQPVGDLDAGAYWRLAERVSGGDVLLEGTPFFVSPLYIYWLALAQVVTGASVTGVLVLQAVLGTFAVWLASRAAALWVPAEARTRVALVAGGALALTGIVGLQEALILQSALDAVLMSAFAYACTRALQQDSPRAWTGCGVALALLGTNRPNAWLLVLPIAAGVWRLGALSGDGRDGPRNRARVTIALILGLAVVLAPFTLRTRVATGEWQVLPGQGGLNFYIGNHADANGTYTVVDGVRPSIEGQVADVQAVASRAAGGPVSSAEASAYFTRRGLTWWQQAPGAAAQLLLYKLWLSTHAWELPVNASYAWFREQVWLLWLLPIGAWLLVPVGLAASIAAHQNRRASATATPRVAGVAAGLGRQEGAPTSPDRRASAAVTPREVGVAAGLGRQEGAPTSADRRASATATPREVGVAAGLGRREESLTMADHRAREAWRAIRWLLPVYLASVALFFVVDRYRAPALVLGAIHLGVLASLWPDRQRVRAGLWASLIPRTRRAIAAVAVAVVVFLGGLVPLPFQLGEAEADTQMALHAIEQQQDVEADRWLASAVARHQAPGVAWFRTGLAWQSRNDLPRAERALREAHRIDADEPEVAFALAGVLLSQGKGADALPLLQHVDRAGLHQDRVRLDLALAQWQSGDQAGARAALARGVPQEGLPLLRARALAAVEARRDDVARWLLDTHRRYVRDDAEVAEKLALMQARAGEVDAATSLLEEAMRLDPNRATARFNLAVIRARQGRRDEAIALLREALRIDPSYAQAAGALQELSAR